MHAIPMDQSLIDFVIKRNGEQSTEFCDASMRLWRRKYRAAHPTEIGVLKCMDGRFNLPVITETPQGIIQPYRNVGGIFDLGWPFFGELIKEWVEYAIAKNRACLVFVTYHFSKGDTHRGCKGMGYDTHRGISFAETLRNQFERVYGTARRIVHPIVVGLETDDESLVFHGERGGSFAIEDHINDSFDDLRQALRNLYPTMLEQTLNDLLPLVVGNQKHVAKIREAKRPPIELQHREQIIAVGRGFDWLHLPNHALIVGPYDHLWPDAVVTAGNIVLDNINSGRVAKEQGALLLVSALSRDESGSHGWNTAIEKARYLERVAIDALKTRVPELQSHLSHMSGVLDAHTRLFHRLN